LNAQAAFVRNRVPNNTDISHLSLDEVLARTNEMGDCLDIDPDEARKYAETQSFYTAVVGDRLFDFVTRHHLLAQFRAEDARGER
jgi:hypothetical protein